MIDLEEGIRKSMSAPWTPRPTYRTNAIDTTPKAHKDRRNRKLRRFFWHLKDDINFLIILLAMFGAGVILWLALAEIEKWMR